MALSIRSGGSKCAKRINSSWRMVVHKIARSPANGPSVESLCRRPMKVGAGNFATDWYTFWVLRHTFSQLYMARIRPWKPLVSMASFWMRWMAFIQVSARASGVVSCANKIMSEGRTSGIPPTFVETVKRPQLAASKIAIQNDSVRELFRKTCPRVRLRRTSELGTVPRNSTLWCSWCCSTITSRFKRLGPSPGNNEQHKSRGETWREHWAKTKGWTPNI